MEDKESVSAALAQRQSSLRRRSSARKDALDFNDRHQEIAWQDSSTVTRCTACNGKFTLTNRKHHCRSCGKVFCGKCSSFELVLQGRMKRACERCHTDVMTQQRQGEHNDKQHLPAVYAGEKVPVPTAAHSATTATDSNSELASVETDSRFPAWLEAFAFVRKPTTQEGSEIKLLYPGSKLSLEMQNEIFRAALSSNRGDNSMNSKEQKFLFRIRDKTLPGFAFKDEDEEMIGTAVTRSTEFFNCYCFYKQVDAGKDVPPYRQAVVLISKWPFPQLAFNMLDKLEEAINWQLNSIDPSLLEKIDEPVVVNSVEGWQEFEEKTTELSLDEIEEASRTQQQQQSNRDIPLQTVENALMAAMSQTNIWPLPCPGSIMYLNFFGEMLNYVVPNDLLNDYSTNLNFRSVLLSINLVSVFGPLGLLQHIWALWELLVMGKDIAVVAPTPALASELVLAIASLLQPVTSIGDLRPYIHGEDSDLMVMAATAQLKQVREQEFEDKTDHFYKIAARKRSMVVGVTDPIALAKLEEFHAVLFIYVPTKNAQLSTSDAAYKGLRTKNSADFFALSPVPSGPKSPVKLNSKAKQPDSFVSAFHTWREKDTKKCGIASRVLPSSFSLDKVLSKIKRMHPDDRLLLGDQLLRENLLDITDSFFAPQTKQRMSIVVDREELVQEKHELNMQKQSISMIKEAEEKGMVKLAMDDFKAGVRSIPEWIRNNVPTVILWTLFSILGGVVIYFGVPIVVVAITALVVKLPEKASLSFELFLRQILPSKVLYPKSHALQEHNHPHSHADEQSGEGINVVVQKFERIVTGKQDLSGVWKRVRTINYEEVLAAQGAGFVQRKLGASISMVHTITMDADLKSFRLQEKAGPIDTDNTYTIDGPELPTITVKTRFLDKVSWTDDGKLRIRKLKSPEQNYELVIYRWLEIGGKSLVVEANFRDLKSGKAVKSYSYFEYVGPSPFATHSSNTVSSPHNSLTILPDSPVSNNTPFTSVSSSATVEIPSTPKIDFSGIWQRVKCENMEAFAAASGAGSMQQKLAATMALKHLISMDYPFCRTICMQEKGGPIDTDFTISIGGESQDIIVNNRKFTQQMYWQDDLLVLRRIAADSSFELLYTRQLIKSNGEQHSTEQYLMKSLHRDLATAKETEALSWFNKVGPSPLVVPSAASSSSITLPAPAISTPTSLSIIPKVEAEDIDDDHDEDEDDDVVLQRMKTRLTERESQLTSTDSPTTSSPLLNLSARIVSSPRKEFSSSTDHLSSLEAFKGVWTKSSGGNNTLGVPNASLGVEGTCNSVQYIDVTGHDVRIVDGSIFGELTEQLEMKLDTDFVASKVKLPTQQAIDIRTRCYLEDKTLVVHRINDSEKYEIYQRRTLESNGKIMRLVNTVVYPSAAEDRVPVESSFMFIKSI